MKKALTIFIGLTVAGATLWAGLPGKPARSSYIGKRWMNFELNNGPSYKWEKLPDGGSIQYWRSDLARCCIGRWNDSFGDRCGLVIRLDKNKVIRQINVTEEGMACGTALR